MVAVALLALLTGCATKKPVGEPLRLVWPAPPEKTRIEFVRSITGQNDLKEDTTFVRSVANFL